MDEKAIAIKIIADSGNSRSYSLEALACLKEKQYDKAKELLKLSEEALLSAKKEHTELLVYEAGKNHVPFSMFLLHSESHLTMAEMTKEYVEAIYDLYLERGNL